MRRIFTPGAPCRGADALRPAGLEARSAPGLGRTPPSPRPPRHHPQGVLPLREVLYRVRTLLPWQANLGKRLVRSPKVLPTDLGLALHAAGLDGARLEGDPTLLGEVPGGLRGHGGGEAGGLRRGADSGASRSCLRIRTA
ncbi:DUF4143 domain-containing protein [Thermus islandicus]|uniref:DUF4143 domain-containing protein n=1 Tax=Thermus islandicus TaxID=540988 RepID=UPI000413810E